MLKILDNTKVYVACPASFQTGGTEALHVLAYELRNLGVDAFMFYRNVEQNQDVVGERFKCFGVPYVFDVDDDEANVLVVPEIWPELLNKYKKLQKAFWWLSLNNCGAWRYLNLSWKDKLKNLLCFKKCQKIDFNDGKILHLAQSQYAWNFLVKNKVKNKAFLADYLRDDFFKRDPNLVSQNRKDIILYNPAKGYEITKKIIAAAPELDFVPLEKMTPTQVCDLCQKSKIYIDFGEHPGKDRFPREAAIQGNIIITGNRGAAFFSEDLPILSKYKFNQDALEPKEVVDLIKDCLKNYDTYINDFSYYRHFIKMDKEKFIYDLRELVGR